MPLAFSYLRFSSPEQAKGDSVRRQTEATADWCARNRAQLDTSLTLRDEGVSAFRGKHRENADMHALAAFMNAVKAGRVPNGSFLVVESLDRLSREKIRPALTLLLNLIEAGVRVVQLQPLEKVYDEDVDPMTLMMAVMELNRGHSESAMKSVRNGAACARKRKEAAAGKVVTRKVPGWFKRDAEGRAVLVDGRLVPDPAKVATVRRVFDLALAGNGAYTIARQLNAEGVPVLARTVFRGRPVVWSVAVVMHMLTSRSVTGEFQPHQGRGADRRPAGEVIPDYYPAVIDADTFHAAQHAIQTRATCGRGRRGKRINLFSGLLFDARDGGTLYYKFHDKERGSAIIPVGAVHGKRSPWSCFPAPPFDAAVISRLREVKVSDVQGDDSAGLKVEALAGRLAETDGLIRAWRAKMDDPAIVDTVAAKLAELNLKRKTQAEALADAQREAASPLAEAWGEFRSLAALLAKDQSDELRLKVRAALRRSIESVTCLFTGRGRVRVAAVRVQFRGGDSHRDYLIVYTPGGSNGTVKRPGRWRALSFAEAAPDVGALDLREPDDARRLEKALLRLST